jgi:hypothetical protein
MCRENLMKCLKEINPTQKVTVVRVVKAPLMMT